MRYNIRNIGVLAHVDAGKTTLTEQMLYAAGAIRSAGRVDEGTAHTDSLAVERQRGISVRAQAACCRWRGVDIRIIDTPGHIDFSAEVDAALLALDGAVLVVSAVEGVQGQTAVIARALRSLGIPFNVFINKTDRSGADVDSVLSQLAAVAPCPAPMWNFEAAIDAISLYDSVLTEQAMQGDTTDEMLREAAARCCAAGLVTPVTKGAALRGEGVDAVLSGIIDWLPAATTANDDALTCVAYRVARKGGERQVFVRVFGGELTIGNYGETGRVKRLRLLTPSGYENVEVLSAGDVGMAVGLSGLRAGEWLGQPVRGTDGIAPAVLQAQVIPPSEAEIPRLQAALTAMQDEEPTLALKFQPRTRQFFVNVRGEVHQQVLQQTLLDEHSVAAAFAPPSVLYKETPLGVGFADLGMYYSPWYAKFSLRVEPGKAGSGAVFASEVSTDWVYARDQNDIRRSALEWLDEGLKGWPVTDVIVTLLDGKSLSVLPGSNMAPVVPLALFDALAKAGTTFLEPMLAFEAVIDAACAGPLLYELTLMRAQFEPPHESESQVTVCGRVPVSASLAFPTRFQALSRGRGLWRTAFDGYQPCADDLARPVSRTRPDPLDKGVFMNTLRGTLG